MSFLAYMMGRGLWRRTLGAGGVDALLAQRGLGALEEDGADLAFDAETRGHLELAGDLYFRALRAGYFPRWAAQRAACVAAARGDIQNAVNAYRILMEDKYPRDHFVYANLLLAAGNASGAAESFGGALAKILDVDQESGAMQSDRGSAEIETLLDAGSALLKSGNYDGARRTLERALATVDLLMGGQAGWIVSETKASGDSPGVGISLTETLLPLVKMSDLLMRLLARTCLASSVAEALRQRELDEGAAVSASGSEEITELLRRELARIGNVVAETPGHVEAHYHYGLLCRALGDLAGAARAFEKVMCIAPYYTRAASRLAVTLLQMGHGEKSPAVLARAFDVPADALVRYYKFALSATDSERFDSAAQVMAREAAGKANLAFALGEVGLLDDVRREWKETPIAAAK
jgi:tetratricopeptide (TPR) repeat protein